MKLDNDFSRELYRMKYKGDDKNLAGTFHRISKDISKIEDNPGYWSKKFFSLTSSGRFLPGGRIVANAGTNNNYLLNCFSMGYIGDSLVDIYDMVKDVAVISKCGGGWGANISKLRPIGAALSVGGESSGPLEFLKVFNTSAAVIQTAGQRRNASLGLMECDHPDIEEFIVFKQGDENKELERFNISVGMFNELIQNIKEDKDWDLQFEDKVWKTIGARDLFKKMVSNMWEYNEPGFLFLDRINYYNNSPQEIVSCNACGEQPNPTLGSCCLGSFNLSQYVISPFEEDSYFDIESFREDIPQAVRFLDNVIDITDYPLDESREVMHKERRIGLGFTGLGDMLSFLGMEYGSQNSLDFVKVIMKTLRDESYSASADLAKEKGHYPDFDEEHFLKQNFVNTLPRHIKDKIAKHGIRHCALNTVAPTGTTSIVLGNNCSSGIEPIPFREYSRIAQKDGKDQKSKVHNAAWRKYKEFMGQENPEVPDFFKTAGEITPDQQLELHEVVQKYIDAAVSKTYNLPSKNYTLKDFEKFCYKLLDSNIKGFTCYNPNGKLKPIISEDGEDRPAVITRNQAPKRPKDLPAKIHRSTTEGEEYIVVVSTLNGQVYEVFAGKLVDRERLMAHVRNHQGKALVRKNGKRAYKLILLDSEDNKLPYPYDLSKLFMSKTRGTITRLSSLSLRHGAPLKHVAEQLKRDNNLTSFEKSLARVISKYVKDGEEVTSSEKCPDCGGRTFIYESGCKRCKCGWVACD